MVEIFVVVKDGTDRYYLLKVEKRGFDVYCFPPHFGVHYSLHKSGEAHFQSEGETNKSRDELPVALITGDAGTFIHKGIRRQSLNRLGSASCIFAAIYMIDSLSKDFRKFDRSAGECFVIDTDSFSKNTSAVEIGVWAVPSRNKVSFEFNNRDIPVDLLYKVAQEEPQIWIYAKPV